MSGLRPIEEQFAAPTVMRIRQLIQRAENFRRRAPEGATKYYFAEVSVTLEAGALLGSLYLAATALELFVRALIVDRVSSGGTWVSYSADTMTYQERLEQDRGFGFQKMLDHLVDVGLFRLEDAEAAKRFYKEVRIPLAHGLLERFINDLPGEWSLSRLLGPGGFTPATRFEEVIERR